MVNKLIEEMKKEFKVDNASEEFAEQVLIRVLVLCLKEHQKVDKHEKASTELIKDFESAYGTRADFKVLDIAGYWSNDLIDVVSFVDNSTPTNIYDVLYDRTYDILDRTAGLSKSVWK